MFDKTNIDNFVSCLNQHFSNKDKNYESTIKCLEEIVTEYGTNEYSFNYAIEMFVELYWEDIKETMSIILDDLISFVETRNYNEKKAQTAFAAYYALSLIYKKKNNIEELGKLLGDAYFLVLRRFPLVFEVRARYHKRIGDYKNALKSDLQAIKILNKTNVVNHAVYVSYASTVALAYESGNTELLGNHEIYEALKYINKAIDFNPLYPKYHFIKGKLTFYKNKNNHNLCEFKDSCEEAKSHIQKAENLLDESTANFVTEYDSYDDFERYIDATIRERLKVEEIDETFKKISPDEVRQKKISILNSRTAQSCRPEAPKLKVGQRYIFISYCTKDYKSVYCDLVELYANKIPFCYDVALTHGKNWIRQIKEKINNKDCIGIIFYLSSNTVLSKSVEEEIEMAIKRFRSAKKLKEHCFWVNLEPSQTPLTFLIKAIKDTDTNVLLANQVNHNRLITYLNTFENEDVFTEKDNIPDSDNHIEELISSIKDKFPDLFENKDNK